MGDFADHVPVRDSKIPEGPRLTFNAAVWTSFLTAVKGDRFPSAWVCPPDRYQPRAPGSFRAGGVPMARHAWLTALSCLTCKTPRVPYTR